MNWVSKKKKEIVCGIFLWANLCYFFGMILHQLESVTGSAYVSEGSAGSIFLRMLDSIPILNRLDKYIVPVQWVIAGFCVIITLFVVCRYGKRCMKERWYVFSYAWTYAVLFLSFDQFDSFYRHYGFDGIDLSFFNRMLIFLLTLLGTVFLVRIDSDEKALIKSYLEKKNGVLFCIVLLYIDFACSGQRLFLSSQKVAWEINLITISIFILFAYWQTPFIFMLLNFLEKQKNKSIKSASDNVPATSIKEKLILLFIPVAIWSIYLVICYPAVLTLDGIDAWREIFVQATFSTAFPVLVKVVWQFLYSIVPTIGIVSILQILLLSTVMTAYLLFFRRKGMTFKLARRFAIIFTLLPSSCLYVITHSSNFYYTVSILWVLYFIMRVIDDNQYMRENPVAVIGLGCAIAGTYLCRNEGFAVVLLICTLLLVYVIRYRVYPIIVGMLLAAGLIFFCNHMLYNNDVANDDMTISNHGGTSLLNDVTLATLYFDGDISEDDKQTLREYASLEEIAGKYTDFQYDTTTGGLLGEYLSDTEQAGAIAMRCILNNIDIAFRERLNKSECVWNVLNAEGAHLDRCARGIVDNNIGLKVNNTVLTKICQEVLYFPTFMFCVTDILLYRSGIYVCVLLVFALYWIKNRRTKLLWLYTPILAHFTVMLLVLLWSCSRHTWCINLMATIVIIYGLVTIRGKCETKIVRGVGEKEDVG